MNQKPFDVLIPALGKDLLPVLQIIVLTFDPQHLPIYRKIWVWAFIFSYIIKNLAY